MMKMKVELEEYFMCKTYKVSHKKQRHRVGRRQSWQSHVSVFNWVGEKAKGRERERVCVYVCVCVWVGLNWTGHSHWQRQSKQRPDKQTDAYSQSKNCHGPMLCWHFT